MKRLLLLLVLFFPVLLFSQDYVQVSYGPGYVNQDYYRLSDDANTYIPNVSWDIAFTAFGNEDAGIFLNEAAGLTQTEMMLFLAPTDNFDDPIVPDSTLQRLLNDEVSWDYGAFNSTRDPSDSLDFGWGIYDPASETFTGTKVFVIQFRNGTYKKIQIQSLDQGVYTFRVAGLDGANEVTYTAGKADAAGADFLYFSLTAGSLLGNPPTGWDLLFTRYNTPLVDNLGEVIDFSLSGTLLARGVQAAKASGVDPETVQYADYEDSLGTELDIIGWDWKEFNSGWILPTDRAYFVKTAAGAVWKIIFVTFDGSSTGNSVFSKEQIGTVNTLDTKGVFTSLDVFPNPVSSEATLTFSLKKAGRVQVQISTMLGRAVWSGTIAARAGFNVAELPILEMPPGQYFLTARFKGEVVTKKLMKF
ncbi:MAG: T9SS type A sorting domain-containing protein [Saprospiraceae bacterium]